MNNEKWLGLLWGGAVFGIGWFTADSGIASFRGLSADSPKWAGYGMMVAGVAMILVGFLSKKK